MGNFNLKFGLCIVASNLLVGHLFALQPNVVAWGDNTYGQTNVPSGLTNAIAISSKEYHTLALQTDGTVVAWGSYYNYGQTNIPLGLSNVVAIAAGDYHSVALQSNGIVVAWGQGDYGATNVPADLTNAIAIAAGGYHNLALRSDGTITGWGRNNFGQLNIPAGLSNVVAIAAGDWHSLVLRADGTIAAWGNYFEGFEYAPVTYPNLSNVVAIASANDDDLALLADGTVVAWGRNDHGQTSVPAGATNVVAMAGGQFCSFALRSDGAIVPWGYNYYGQFNVPAGISNIVAVSGGANHSLALSGRGSPFLLAQLANRTVLAGTTAYFHADATGLPRLNYQWQLNGTNLVGATNATLVLRNVQLAQAGDYSVSISNTLGAVVSSAASLTVLPFQVSTQPQSQVSFVGGNASFGLTVQGTGPFYYQWQCNGTNITGATNSILSFSSLGLGQSGSYSLIVSNAYGVQTSSVVRLDVGRVAAWGDNRVGQCNVPAGLVDVAAIACGWGHSMALMNDGIVAAWGDGYYGQTNVPASLNNVTSISAGDSFSLALQDNGTVTGWGADWYGQIDIPPGLTDVVAITAGFSHGLALRTNGTVVAWGNDDQGETNIPAGLNDVVALAPGGMAERSVVLRSDGAVVVWGDTYFNEGTIPAGLSKVVAIADGGEHILALQSDGTVVAWGYNFYGQATVPAGLSNVVAIGAGYSHSLALRSDGTLVAWGEGNLGQTSLPSGLSNVVAIACGSDYSLALIGTGAPVITVQPFRFKSASGGNLDLQVMAVGTPPLNYQWQLEGTNLPGATNAILHLENAIPGHYQVVVANSLGAVTSSQSTVTVLPAFKLGSGTGMAYDGFHLRIGGLTGQGRIVIYASTNLTGFQPIFTNPPITGSFDYVDRTGTNIPEQFYRVSEE